MSYADIRGESGFLWIYDDVVRNAHSLTRIVEVGLGIGHSIAYLLHLAAGRNVPIEVWGVDPFLSTTGRNGEQQDRGDRAGGDFNLFLDSIAACAPAERELLRLVRAPSTVAARLFDDETLDLVLIDANHDYEFVRKDIAAWWPKVRRGGLLAGDDHCQPYGVARACRDAFGAEYSVKPTPPGQPGNPCWWKVKP